MKEITMNAAQYYEAGVQAEKAGDSQLAYKMFLHAGMDAKTTDAIWAKSKAGIERVNPANNK
jgi:hypothetical protein